MAMSIEDKRRLKEIFDDLDTDGDGFLTPKEFERGIREANVKINQLSGSAAAQKIVNEADVSGDRKVSFEEFLDAAQYKTNALGESTGTFNALVRYLAQTGTGSKNEPVAQSINCWPPPIFLIVISIIQIGVYVAYTREDCPNANECPVSFSAPLAFRMCCRDEVWRFFTYALMHAGVPHIAFNLIIQLLIGVPMELMNGAWRMALLYLMGVLAASLGSSVFDPEANVVGASGAVYAILGAWIAELTQNWDTMPFRWPRLIATVTLAGLDLGNQIWKRFNAEGESSVSFAGHFVGFVGGITFGTYILHNIKERPLELYVRWGGIATYVSGVIFAVFYNIFYTYDPKGLCDIPGRAKCA